ncbi:MAG: transporter [Planctomycetota bacterium]
MYRLAISLIATLVGAGLSAQSFAMPSTTHKQLRLFQSAHVDECECEHEGTSDLHWDDMPETGDHSRADSHAPIGVMGDHMHHAGEFMLGYRFMLMEMRGMREGTSLIDKEDVLDDYMITPTDGSMAMHMFGFMWAPVDELTITVMTKVIDRHMDVVTRMGVRDRMHASGLGDTGVALLVRAFDIGSHHLHLNLKVGLPTGAINKKDTTPMSGGKRVILPYQMQLGTGSVSGTFGFTYTANWSLLSWGFQPQLTVQGHRNYRGYRVGNRFQSDAWVAVAPVRWASVSVRARYAVWTSIYGRDIELNKNMTPAADDDNIGAKRIDLGVGLNLYIPKGLLPFGALDGQRLAFEFTLPVMQAVNGYQMNAEWALTVGWQWAF